MISKEHRTILKKLLRGNYVKDVLEKLAQKGVLSKSGKPYSSKMISHILSGYYDNPDIENAIFEVYQERKEKQAQEELKRNRVLGILPPKEDNTEI